MNYKVCYVSEFSICTLQNADGELPRNQYEIDHYTSDVSAILIKTRTVAPQIYATDKQFFGNILKPWLYATQTNS